MEHDLTDMATEDARGLEAFFDPLRSQLPADDDETFVFDRENVPVPPPALATETLTILKGIHAYEEPVPTLRFFASRQTYQCLGLLLVSCVFLGHVDGESPRGSHTVVLNNENSEIRKIRVSLNQRPGLTLQVVSHEYWAQPRERYPLSPLSPRWRSDLALHLTDSEGVLPHTARLLEERDEVIIRGFDTDLLQLADVLLDIARASFIEFGEDGASPTAGEWHLEAPQGFGGVSDGSAEACFYLEGSIAWMSGEVIRSTPRSLLEDVGRDDLQRIKLLSKPTQRALIDELRSMPRYPRPDVVELIRRFSDRDA
jgi:hypothetical protein